MASTQASEAEITEAYARCRAITRQRARNFYFGFLSLPPRRRDALSAVYAFCRACDDFSDDGAPAKEKLHRLQQLRAGLGQCFAGNPAGPVFIALRDASQRYSIDQGLFEEIITGVEMDLTFRRYATFDDLYKYCHRVASVVGLISIQIFGYKDGAARQHAVDLGIAMQLVNILRDIKEDAARDRVYLPAEDLNRFGYGESNLFAGRVNEQFAELMQFEAARAREYFQKGAALLPLVDPGSRACPTILVSLYTRLLDHIEARHWDIFQEPIRLPTTEKIWLASKAWTGLTFKRILHTRR